MSDVFVVVGLSTLGCEVEGAYSTKERANNAVAQLEAWQQGVIARNAVSAHPLPVAVQRYEMLVLGIDNRPFSVAP